MKIDVFTGGFFQTNGYLLVHPDGRLLVDAPEGIADWLDAQGIVPDALLLTHLHYDHVIDVAAIRERYGCPVWAHSTPDPDLTLETVLKETIGWPFKLDPFEIDRTLAVEEEIEVAGLRISLLHVPGHSPDSLCYLLGPAAQSGDPSLLFGGDVLFRGGIGRTDFPHGDHGLLLDGIRTKLYRLSDSSRVFPGHGAETTIGREKESNPFVRP